MQQLIPRKIPINKPSITEKEIAYVNDAITNGWGEKCYDYIYLFEEKFKNYLGTKYALATSSCTGAIHLALMAMGVNAGDEVIVPEITWIASVEPILYIGAKPIFVDVCEDSWCIDPEKLEKAITPKTKAIIVVHVYGNLCEMEKIKAIAKKFNLVILEDAAEALGSEYADKKAGSIADAGVFSFHGTKTMTTGEGGMLVTSNTDIYEKAKILNDHGRNPKDPEHKMFWMRNYGYKYKISNVQAALGCAQIERIEELVSRKREIFEWYKTLLEKDISCKLNPEKSLTKNSYWLPTIVIDKSIKFDRENYFSVCKKNGIDTRPFFYPLSSLPMFTKCDNPVSYDVSQRGINLPSFHEIQYDEVKFVTEVLIDYLNKK